MVNLQSSLSAVVVGLLLATFKTNAEPTALPSDSPSPSLSATPSANPTVLPTLSPSEVPPVVPSGAPSSVPSGLLSSSPSATPTSLPTLSPSEVPSVVPSDARSSVPSGLLSSSPSATPTSLPTLSPSEVHSVVPSIEPSSALSDLLSSSPSAIPTALPTLLPSEVHSVVPSDASSSAPSGLLSSSPSAIPMSLPTFLPSEVHSVVPSDAPSAAPSSAPSAILSSSPSVSVIPTELPPRSPTEFVSVAPSVVPSSSPSGILSSNPSVAFSAAPSFVPTATLTFSPSTSPSDDATGYDRVTERIDYWATETNTASRIFQLITYRETLLGCDSFHEYLSPFFHTLIVLPRDIAYALEVDQLVLDEPSNTAGIHLFLTDDIGGHLHALKVAEQFISTELEPKGIDIRYLHSTNCDVHQFSTGHSRFVPFEQLALRLERDFDTAKQFRSLGRSLATNYDAEGYPSKCWKGCSQYFPFSDVAILGMNTVFFEDVPTDDNSEEFGHFHSNDFENWWANGGWASKPSNLTHAGLPWFFDVSRTVQEHSLMFDLELLRSVKEEYFSVAHSSFPGGKSFIGKFAQVNNMTLIRHNDVALHLNLAHSREFLNYPASLDLDWFKTRNLEIFAAHRNPRDQEENWDRVRSNTDVNTPSKVWTQFLFAHFRRDTWLPDSIGNLKKPVTDPTVRKVLEAILWYCGYIPKGTVDGALRFEIEQVYSGTRLVRFESVPGINRRTIVYKFNGVSYSLYIDKLNAGAPAGGTTYVLEIPVEATLKRNGFKFID